MKMNRKGVGGFMEAVMAMMVVTVALTAFLGLLSYNNAGDFREDHVDTEFLDDFSIVGGRITGDAEEHLYKIMDSNGYQRVDLKMTVDTVEITGYELTVGGGTTDDTVVFHGTVRLASDDGRILVSSYEVVCWS